MKKNKIILLSLAAILLIMIMVPMSSSKFRTFIKKRYMKRLNTDQKMEKQEGVKDTIQGSLFLPVRKNEIKM